jgi:hypothetical protein
MSFCQRLVTKHPVGLAIVFDCAGYLVLDSITWLSMILMCIGGGLMLWNCDRAFKSMNK